MFKERIVLRAPAKINLFLKVTGRRPDGYHTLETRMQKLNLFDELSLSVRDKPGISLVCPDSDLPEDKGNIVYRAAKHFLTEYPWRGADDAVGVHITLKKNIPLAAGLGGGSSDAAACLRGLNILFDCGLPSNQLAALALKLGADVPFFLLDAPAALARGIGEILEPVSPLPPCSVVLVNPGFPLSTQWVYQNFALTEKENKSNLFNSQNAVYEKVFQREYTLPEESTHAFVNDLEQVSIAAYPEIKHIKESLNNAGAFACLMSGSGPTVFGLFAKKTEAEACFVFFARRFPRVFLLAPIDDNGRGNFE